MIFGDLDANNDGIVDEDEFVEGCLADPNFLFMLEHFSCDFLWGNVVFKWADYIWYVWAQSLPVVLAQVYGKLLFFFKDKKVEFLTGRVRLETADLLRESWLGN